MTFYLNPNDLKKFAICLKNIENPMRNIARLISHIKNVPYHHILFNREKIEMRDEEYTIFLNFLYRLMKNEPISKIINKKEFYGFEFFTNEYTLDPRFETEIIVDIFRKYISNTSQNLNILDLGCGTGCIGISIMNIYKNVYVDFVDIENKTLGVCMMNARKYNVLDRSNFIQSNWFQNIHKKYDTIVSNPPYISTDYKLDRSVLFDPYISLFSGKNGMDSYREIIPNIHKFLVKNGHAFIEIGFDQYNQIMSLIHDNFNIKFIECIKDLNGIDRTFVIQNISED